MKIAVIGAGVVGICTAYELASDGHTVSVYERHGSVAEEASFACAGHLSPSLSHPLSFPAWPLATRWRAMGADSGIALGRGISLGDVRWLMAWKRGARDFAERFAAAQSLVHYSLERQKSLSQHACVVIEQSQGQLMLVRTERDAQALAPRLEALKAQGVAAQLLMPQQARQLEPALGADIALHSAVHFPQDSAGNCRQFAHALKERALELGVQFHFDTPVNALTCTPSPQLHTPQGGALDFEHVVVCAGTAGAALLGAELRHVALARLDSYSLSAQIREPLNAPRSAVLDVHNQTSISRMGSRIRVSGGAELGGVPTRQRQASARLLYQALQTLFPGAADFSRSMQLWKGSSMFSPDGLPLLGASARPGLWLNLAHGHNGWAMACGCARVLADQIAGRQAALESKWLLPARFPS